MQDYPRLTSFKRIPQSQCQLTGLTGAKPMLPVYNAKVLSKVESFALFI